jgi:hypothetical protein
MSLAHFTSWVYSSTTIWKTRNLLEFHSQFSRRPFCSKEFQQCFVPLHHFGYYIVEVGDSPAYASNSVTVVHHQSCHVGAIVLVHTIGHRL